MLWLRVALLGVILAAVAAAVIKVTSFLHEKDLMIQERDQQIADLRAKVEGLRIDTDRLKQSNASLEGEVAKKRDELARVQREAGVLHATDAASAKRLNELERRLSDREHQEQMERVRNSRRAELALRITNRSAKCDLENFFKTGGTCKNGQWVKDGERLVPIVQPAGAQPPVEAQPAGDSHETR